MSDKSYNGWQNFETWAVNMWLTNDEGLNDELIDKARQAWESRNEIPTYLVDVRTPRQHAIFELADTLKEWVTEMAPDLGGTLWADLLGAALSEVKWDELAENVLSDDGEFSDTAEVA